MSNPMDLAEIEGLKRRVETLQAERDEAFDHHNTLRAKIATLQTERNQMEVTLRLCKEPLQMMAYTHPKFVSLDGNIQDPYGVHQALTEVLKLVPS